MGKRHGEGEVVYRSGVRKRGVWEKGKKIREL